MMIVFNWCAIVILFSMREWFLRVVSEVRHMFLILIVRVATFMSHWVNVGSVQTAMVHWAVIEVLLFVVRTMVSVLHVPHLMPRLFKVLTVVLSIVPVLTLMITVQILDIMISMDSVMLILMHNGDVVVNCGLNRVHCCCLSIAVAVGMVRVEGLVVAVTSVWVVGEMGALASGVVLHGLFIAIVLGILVVRSRSVQVLTPSVILSIIVEGAVRHSQALILSLVAKAVTLEFILISLTVIIIVVATNNWCIVLMIIHLFSVVMDGLMVH